MGERMGEGFSWLFGRRSYEDMLSHWNAVGGPFKDGLNNVTKYVASSSPHAELPWPNSTLLSGDVPAAVAALREQPGGNLVIMGSGALVRSLLPHGLIDELFLMIIRSCSAPATACSDRTTRRTGCIWSTARRLGPGCCWRRTSPRTQVPRRSPSRTRNHIRRRGL